MNPQIIRDDNSRIIWILLFLPNWDAPPLPQPVAVFRPNPGTTLDGAIQRNDANALAFGLAEAGRKGQVKPGSTTWNKVQDAIKLLRRGKTRDEAISLSQVDKTTFNQLLEWGQL